MFPRSLEHGTTLTQTLVQKQDVAVVHAAGWPWPGPLNPHG